MKATWKRNSDPDAEHNSHITTYNGHQLEVYSDREESIWDYSVDGNTSIGYESKEDAMREAERDAGEP